MRYDIIIKEKIKELEESYELWLDEYEKDETRYSEERLNEIKGKIILLEDILERGK